MGEGALRARVVVWFGARGGGLGGGAGRRVDQASHRGLDPQAGGGQPGVVRTRTEMALREGVAHRVLPLVEEEAAAAAGRDRAAARRKA